jgi:hypothetical protein
MQKLTLSRQADMMAYWRFHHPLKEEVKGIASQSTTSPHQGMAEAWAKANTNKNWSRRTGSSPEAIEWALNGD